MKTRILSILLPFAFCACIGCSLTQKTPVISDSKGKTQTRTGSTGTGPTQRSAPTGSFEVIGKASLSDGKRHAQISLRWKQIGEHYEIHLYGPLGHGAVRLSNTDHPTMHSDPKQSNPQSKRSKPPKPYVQYQDMKGEVRSYGSAEALLEKECGWKLPISGLSWWLRGLARPLAPAIVVPDKTGLSTQIEQDGWTIEYLTYKTVDGKTYPYKVRLSRNKLILKFVLRDWHIDTTPPA